MSTLPEASSVQRTAAAVLLWCKQIWTHFMIDVSLLARLCPQLILQHSQFTGAAAPSGGMLELPAL
jgi:hypothetical protein